MLRTLLVVLLTAAATLLTAHQPRPRDWPAITREARPWTRWWWHGSAVDRSELTRELQALAEAGIGGVEITPIYGVRGEELRFIPFLSDTWMERLEHTLGEARRLDVGVDMATGTGWPFGGPWVGDDAAPRSLAHRTWTLEAGGSLSEPVRLQQTPLVRAPGNQVYEVGETRPGEPRPAGTTQKPQLRKDIRPLQIGDIAQPVTANRNLQVLALEQVKYPRDLPLVSVVAYGDSGAVTDLTPRVRSDRTLEWTAPERSTIYALFAGWHGKLVERAAPGGEGNVIDHFSSEAIRGYLAPFDRAFARRNPLGLRAFFNDSYEVDDASGQGDWTPRLLDEFRTRRGYDLRRHLPALFGRDTDDRNARVLADFRETVSDLLLETFTTEWAAWAHRRGSVTRNQAHGAPANLLDLYAASDIPETEGTDVPRLKWATSAANVSGKRLVSAEAATWLGEHFRTTLAEVRAAVDFFLLAGVNHVVYHGTAYSPDGEPWPGWQFYAAVEFSPQTSWWDDFAALNGYVARAQSFLQSGRADHDVLLYFPFHDAVAVRGKALLTHFGGANRPSGAAGFDEAARLLESRGFTYDYISDRQLRATKVDRSTLLTGGGARYKVIVLPPAEYIPLDTARQVLALAERGATVVVIGDGARDVSGFHDLDRRREAYRRLWDSLRFGPADPNNVSVATRGSGRVIRAAGLEHGLDRAGVARERLVDRGVSFARRADAYGRVYFVSNRTSTQVDGWMPFNIGRGAATIFDPMSGRRGTARTRTAEGTLEVYLELAPGGSLIVAESAQPHPDAYEFYAPSGVPLALRGPWRVTFVKGGPALPAARSVDRLESWTAFEGDAVKAFSGTATYTVTFPKPGGAARTWLLDFGRVHESARVRLNGTDIGTLIGPPFRLAVDDAALRATNTLEVHVTNLSANRIADLDRRGVAWKKFYNVNMPSRFPQNRGADGLFTAATWDPLESGLVGPVVLSPAAPVR